MSWTEKQKIKLKPDRRDPKNIPNVTLEIHLAPSPQLSKPVSQGTWNVRNLHHYDSVLLTDVRKIRKRLVFNCQSLDIFAQLLRPLWGKSHLSYILCFPYQNWQKDTSNYNWKEMVKNLFRRNKKCSIVNTRRRRKTKCNRSQEWLRWTNYGEQKEQTHTMRNSKISIFSRELLFITINKRNKHMLLSYYPIRNFFLWDMESRHQSTQNIWHNRVLCPYL